MQQNLGVTVARKNAGELEITIQPGNPLILADADAAKLASETDNAELADAIRAALAVVPTAPVVGRE